MKILTITDNPNLTTGFARVHRHVIDALKNAGHDVLPCVWFGYDTKSIISLSVGNKVEDIEYNDIKMLNVPKRDGTMNDMKVIYDICVVYKPDVVLTIGDLADFYYVTALKQKLDYSFKWFAYLTIETYDYDKKLLQLFKHMDVIAVPSDFSKRSVDRMIYLEKMTCVPVNLVPFGIEEIFFETKQEIRAEEKIKFITVAANTWRKDLPVIIKTASILKNKYGLTPNELEFYIHTNTYKENACDPFLYDLVSLAKFYGVSEYFSFPERNSVFVGKSDLEMAQLYAQYDYFICPSICESFAFPVLEAMAIGLPFFSKCGEVLGDYCNGGFGITVNSDAEIIPPDRVIYRIKAESLAEMIHFYVTDWKDRRTQETRNKMSEVCQRYAREFRWEKMESAVVKLIEGLSNETEIPIDIL